MSTLKLLREIRESGDKTPYSTLLKQARKFENGGFRETFKSAREQQGSEGTFEWNGKSYNTKYKEEVSAPIQRSFNQAFKEARETLGAGKEFEWNNNKYTTDYKEEIRNIIKEDIPISTSPSLSSTEPLVTSPTSTTNKPYMFNGKIHGYSVMPFEPEYKRVTHKETPISRELPMDEMTPIDLKEIKNKPISIRTREFNNILPTTISEIQPKKGIQLSSIKPEYPINKYKIDRGSVATPDKKAFSIIPKYEDIKRFDLGNYSGIDNALKPEQNKITGVRKDLSNLSIDSPTFNSFKKFEGFNYSMQDRGGMDSSDCSSTVCRMYGIDYKGVSSEDLLRGGETKNFKENTSIEEMEDGMLIFFDTGDTSFDKGRKFGVDHVGVVIKDKNTGEIYIGENANGEYLRGTGVSLLKDRINYLNKNNKLKKYWTAEPVKKLKTK